MQRSTKCTQAELSDLVHVLGLLKDAAELCYKTISPYMALYQVMEYIEKSAFSPEMIFLPLNFFVFILNTEISQILIFHDIPPIFTSSPKSRPQTCYCDFRFVFSDPIYINQSGYDVSLKNFVGLCNISNIFAF